MSLIKENNNVLIISFGSMGRITIAPTNNNFNMNHYFDFFDFLPNNFKNVDFQFYGDPDQYCYHKGIRGVSTNIESTVKFLKDKIGDRYKKVIFMGLSGGGYAAILFGSLLNVSHVVAFYPLTKLVNNRPEYEDKYKDLLPHINKTTDYLLLGTGKTTNKHHLPQHCERICVSDNVVLKVYDVVDNIKHLMRECKIVDILNGIIDDDDVGK